MTKFTINADNSIRTTADQATAFQSGSTHADSLIVETGAYLTTGGIGANGATLDNTGGWTVNVNGVVDSIQAFGILLTAGNEERSTIEVGTNAVVGGFVAIYAESAVMIRNQGFIASGRSSAIEVVGDDRHELINQGSINAPQAFQSEFGASVDIIRNSGTIYGSLFLGDGDDRVENASLIQGDMTKYYVDLGDGDDRLTNSGKIRIDILDSSGDDAVFNGGTIQARVRLGYGDDTFTNVIKVDGRPTSGAVTQEIDLGEGDDRLDGGRFTEDYHDAGGSDVAMLAGGDDIYRATINGDIDGKDSIDGGKGIDIYDASLSNNVVYINLDSVAHEMPFSSGRPRIAAGTALGADIAGTQSDRIKGFETVFAGTSDDIVFGSQKANYIDGGDGIDILLGLGGNDRLFGSFGEDFLQGGAGMDVLTGGTGSDHFMFASIGDSDPGTLLRDRIADFQDGTDVIDLSQIDAVKGGGNDAFHFIGANVAFTGAAGELRVYRSVSGHIIEADVDGDKISDFSIAVADTPNSITLSYVDFEL